MDSIKIGKVTFIHGDCMEYLEGLGEGAFDLAIVDPPYGIGVNKMDMGSRKTIKPSNKNWDNSIPSSSYFNELFKVSKNQIIWGGNYFPLPQSQYFAIWDKGETMYGRDFAECEYAWVGKGGTRIYKKNPNQLDRIHPTQKPVQLYKWLLINYAKEGQTILDTHGGSGSIAIACHELGYELTIIEKDKEYFDNMVERFKTHIKQLKLF